jgi:hypothetical protein
MTAERRGALTLGLLGNAMFTVSLQVAWLLLTVRVVRRARSQSHLAAAILDVSRSTPGVAVIGATVVHSILRRFAARMLDRQIDPTARN